MKQNPITGIYEHSWPVTLERWKRFYAAAKRSQVHFARSHYSGNLLCVWPGNEIPFGGVPLKLGELPRERAITELRAWRQASRLGGDPLTIGQFYPKRKCRLNRLRMALVRPAFMTRLTNHGLARINPSTTA